MHREKRMEILSNIINMYCQASTMTNFIIKYVVAIWEHCLVCTAPSPSLGIYTRCTILHTLQQFLSLSLLAILLCHRF